MSCLVIDQGRVLFATLALLSSFDKGLFSGDILANHILRGFYVGGANNVEPTLCNHRLVKHCSIDICVRTLKDLHFNFASQVRIDRQQFVPTVLQNKRIKGSTRVQPR